jgi:transcriptional regulator with XRE-family HTH domain
MPDPKKTFATRVKATRESQNLSQSALARKLNITPSSISKMESLNNDVKPSIETLVAIAKTFGVSIDYLVGLSNSPSVATPIDGGSLPSWLKNNIYRLAGLDSIRVNLIVDIVDSYYKRLEEKKSKVPKQKRTKG